MDGNAEVGYFYSLNNLLVLASCCFCR
uniref:Uncharacterized protein n=1 Tax=Anguilla anguilla TaxID=7936 RepID=A0A0E9V091_ANGAN